VQHHVNCSDAVWLSCIICDLAVDGHTS